MNFRNYVSVVCNYCIKELRVSRFESERFVELPKTKGIRVAYWVIVQFGAAILRF